MVLDAFITPQREANILRLEGRCRDIVVASWVSAMVASLA